MRQTLIYLTEHETIDVSEIQEALYNTHSSVVKGLRYYTGFLCAQDYQQAYAAFDDACKDSIFADIMKANCLLLGIGTNRNPKAAMTIYRKRKDASVIAHYNYAYCLELGIGVKRDAVAAVREYKKIEKDHDFPMAVYRLGLCHYHGEGTPKNRYVAYGYFLQLSYEGHKKATALLAQMYECGDGIDRDLFKALDLYSRNGGGILNAPYGVLEPDEISYGYFLDYCYGALPCKPDSMEALFVQYVSAKAGDISERVNRLRALARLDFVDANGELADLLWQKENSGGTNQLEPESLEAIDLSIKNAYVNAHMDSFAFLRRFFWSIDEAPNDALTELFTKETVLVYDKFVNDGLCDEQEIFEFACICFLGLCCDRDEAKAIALADRFFINMADHHINEARLIFYTNWMFYAVKHGHPLHSLPPLFLLQYKKWHDCQKILHIVTCTPETEADIKGFCHIARSLSNPKIAAYMVGLVCENAGEMTRAANYYESALHMPTEDEPIKRMARNRAEALIEDHMIRYISDRYIPALWGLALGRKVGDQLWAVGNLKKATEAYLCAAKEGDKLSIFAFERACMLTVARYQGAANMRTLLVESNPIAAAAFDVYAYIYTEHGGEVNTVNAYLKQIGEGNHVADWFRTRFNDAHNAHAPILAEMQDTNGVFSQNQHMTVFMHYRFDNQTGLFDYYCCLFAGKGIKKDEQEGFKQLSAMAEKGYVPALLAIAHIMSDQQTPFFDIKKAANIYNGLAAQEHPDAFEGLAKLGEAKLLAIDSEQITRLHFAAKLGKMRQHFGGKAHG